jgi:hypothetical protein
MEFIIPLVLRLIGPLLIMKKPFWGMILAIGLDTIDFDLIAFFHEMLNGDYYVYYPTYVVFDKSLDLYMGMIGVIASKVWQPLIHKTMIALLSWRIIGVLLFLILNERYIFFFFPYIFDFFFLYYAFTLQYKPELKPTTKKEVATVLAILLIPKLMQEYFLHILDSKPLVHFRYDILKSPR